MLTIRENPSFSEEGPINEMIFSNDRYKNRHPEQESERSNTNHTHIMFVSTFDASRSLGSRGVDNQKIQIGSKDVCHKSSSTRQIPARPGLSIFRTLETDAQHSTVGFVLFKKLATESAHTLAMCPSIEEQRLPCRPNLLLRFSPSSATCCKLNNSLEQRTLYFPQPPRCIALPKVPSNRE